MKTIGKLLAVLYTDVFGSFVNTSCAAADYTEMLAKSFGKTCHEAYIDHIYGEGTYAYGETVKDDYVD